MTDKTVLVCVCVCACAHVCTFLLTFGQTVYQGLLAAPRWPLIHPQHNDSSEEQKEANHYIKTDCIRLRRNVCPCVCVAFVLRRMCSLVCMCMSCYVLNTVNDWRRPGLPSREAGKIKNRDT